MTHSPSAAGFERTQWSDVLKAAHQSPEATQAFDRLAKAYWRPLYEFVQRRGFQPADSEDLVQDFFAFLIEKKPLESVDPAKGRFRSFLLGVLRHYMANKKSGQRAQKRGGGRSPLPLDGLLSDSPVSAELSIDCSPDEIFDADWAEALVNNALAELKAEYETAGRANVFGKLNAYLSPAGGSSSYAAVAQELSMSEDAVKMAVNRLRRRFRRCLRSRIAETVSNEDDVEREYGYLMQVLTRKQA